MDDIAYILHCLRKRSVHSVQNECKNTQKGQMSVLRYLQFYCLTKYLFRFLELAYNISTIILLETTLKYYYRVFFG